MMMVFFGILLLVFFWGGLIFLGVWLVRAIFSSRRRSDTKSTQEIELTARNVLDRRYVQGEITRDQYERMKNDLE